MQGILDYLKVSVSHSASDLFVIAGAPVSMKIAREVIPIEQDKVMPPETLALLRSVYELAERSMDKLQRTGDDDFSFASPGLARFRVTAYRQRGSYAMVIRVVAFEVPDYRTLKIQEEIMNLATVRHGMILVTGVAGSGKSTTEACIIDRINRTRACHIVTMEDPIEYLHRDNMSIISQREISIDTEDFLSALKSCLRQAPDVIQLGEMRDAETIRAAVTAAETGHLLLATLHTNGAANAIDRIIDSFPPDGQHQIRVQLSAVLHTVISQKLIPNGVGGSVAAFEILHANNAVRSLIRDSKTHQIDNAISTGAADGMITMDQYILKLYKDRSISERAALDYCDDSEQMKKRIRGF